ncbi:hypothetical protein ACFV4G_15610 [Kitasatospora sp. NPDC059747]|uniref:hypothetical protein n=1 Tax=Kitasatospora sp. NPDC059747 TaxID=3346930 RepID=UPI00365118C0
MNDRSSRIRNVRRATAAAALAAVLSGATLSLAPAATATAATARTSTAAGVRVQAASESSALSATVQVTNVSGRTMYVIAGPNADWLAADFVADLALMANGIGEIKGAVTAGRLPETIRTVKDLRAFIGVSGELLMGTVATGSRSAEAVAAAGELLGKARKHAITIEPGKSANVFDRSLLDIILSPSGIASIFGASDVSLSAFDDDGNILNGNVSSNSNVYLDAQGFSPDTRTDVENPYVPGDSFFL